MIRKLFILSLLFIVSLSSLKETEASSITFEFTSNNLFSDVYALTDTQTWNPADQYLILEIPMTTYTIFARSGAESYIYLDNTDPADDIYIYFDDLVEPTPAAADILKGIFVIDLSGYAISGHNLISLVLIQSYTSTPGGYVDWFNNLFQASNDTTDLNTARFYTQGILYDEIIFFRFVTNLPPNPPNPPGRFFTVWYTSDGEELSTEEIYTTDLIVYAGYQSQLTGVSPPVEIEPATPAGLQDLLTFTGFWNNAGFIIMYTTVILFVTFGLLFMKIRGIFIIIALIAITSSFIFMGLLPIYAAIILILTFALGVMNALKSGGGAISE